MTTHAPIVHMQAAGRDALLLKPNTLPATGADAARAQKNIVGKRAQAPLKLNDFGLTFFPISEQSRQMPPKISRSEKMLLPNAHKRLSN